jgi:glycerophosphoryl diester phosphodiesterase
MAGRDMPADNARTIDIVSHRAAGGTHPENTLAGIHASLAAGVDAIEIDVRATRDGVLVLMHDETLERTTGDPRPIAEVTARELRALRVIATSAGGDGGHPPEPVPTLEEALRAIEGRAAIVVDFVLDEIADACVEAVRRAGADEWTWWTAHSPRLAASLLAACPGARSFLGWTPNDGIAHAPAEALDIAERHGLAGLMANHRYVDAAAVDYAHGRGLAIYCWTVNDAGRMAELAALGVDGMTTDYPGRLREVLRRPRGN